MNDSVDTDISLAFGNGTKCYPSRMTKYWANIIDGTTVSNLLSFHGITGEMSPVIGADGNGVFYRNLVTSLGNTRFSITRIYIGHPSEMNSVRCLIIDWAADGNDFTSFIPLEKTIGRTSDEPIV